MCCSIAIQRAAGLVLLALLSIGGSAAVGAQEATTEDQRVQRLEEELARLRASLEELQGRIGEEASESSLQAQVEELARRIEILAAELERDEIEGGGIYRRPEQSEHGLGVAASKVYQTEQGISIGGYGEALFESYDSSRDDGTRSGRTDRFDLLRAVVYFGYKFNDRWIFNSEIEFEHASTGKNGEASVEFAYVDYLWRPEVNFRGGLVLVPMGFVNELHEAPLYLGARRPDVERHLIPATWRENGVGIFGDVGPLTYRSYLLAGLDASGFSAGGIRGGRQSGSQSSAEDLAWVGRLDYTARPGLLAGISAYVGDSGQGLSDATGAIGASTTILEGHVEYESQGFELRILGVRSSVGDVERLNGALGLMGSGSVGERMEGYYAQLGYDVFSRRASGERALIPFVRWESFDTQDRVPSGFARDPANDVDIFTVGLSFKPLDELVFKAEYQDFRNAAGTGTDQINLGMGYLF